MIKMVLGLFLASLLSMTGCSLMQEEAKVLWGSSTKALEDARGEAVKKIFACHPDECFDRIIQYCNIETEMTKQDADGFERINPEQLSRLDDDKTIKVKNLEVFIKDRKNKKIVVMGIPGHVNTTEAGIFFTTIEGKGTSVEVVSLSTAAKIKAANLIFAALGKDFKEIQ
ncbi:MAG: hypothetical protein H6754_01755 [Candidatus Omnitrophica bacterium]|nr:hypothetical protein [Candidatus Omnitrophota bacterium]